MKNIPIIIAVAYILMMAGIMLYAGGTPTIAWFIGAVFFFALASAPQFLMIYFSDKADSKTLKEYYIAVQLFLSLVALYVYFDGFFISLDPQNGLLFVFIPLYQLMFAMFAFYAQKAFSRFRRQAK